MPRKIIPIGIKPQPQHLKAGELSRPHDPMPERMPPTEIVLHDALAASFRAANLSISLCHSSLRHLSGTDLSGEMVGILRDIFTSTVVLQHGLADLLGQTHGALLSQHAQPLADASLLSGAPSTQEK